MQPITLSLIFQIIVFATILYTLFSYWKKDLIWWHDRKKNFVYQERYRTMKVICPGCNHTEEFRHYDPMMILIMGPVFLSFFGHMAFGLIGGYLAGLFGVVWAHKLVFKEHICKGEKCKCNGADE